MDSVSDIFQLTQKDFLSKSMISLIGRNCVSDNDEDDEDKEEEYEDQNILNITNKHGFYINISSPFHDSVISAESKQTVCYHNTSYNHKQNDHDKENEEYYSSENDKEINYNINIIDFINDLNNFNQNELEKGMVQNQLLIQRFMKQINESNDRNLNLIKEVKNIHKNISIFNKY